MEPNRDIYTTPNNEPEQPGPLRSVEPTPAQVRARTLRNSIGFTVIMLALLGFSTWFVYEQEQRSIQPKEEEAVDTTTLLTPVPLVTNATASTTPARITIPEPLPRATETETQIDPQKTALAMSEMRIATDYLNAKDMDKAEAHARKALDIWPNMNAANRMIGVIYTQRGQFDQAIALLEQALKVDASSVETYNNLATAYIQKGMLDKAEEMLNTSLQIHPDYEIAYLNLGLLNLLRGRYDAAADYYERAVEKVPNDPNPRNNLAVSLIRLGRYDDARKQLNRIIEQRPDIANSYFNMAVSYVYAKDLAQAMEWIRRGSQHCSPMVCQRYLSDSDFNAIRNLPPFQEFVKSLSPDLPAPPKE